MDDLVFEVGLDPSGVEAMTVARIVYWHKRAVAYYRKRARKQGAK